MSQRDDEWLVHAKERRALKGDYKALFEAVSAILFRHDPIGLDNEDNIDEYDPEVSAILPLLKRCHSVSDVQAVVHREFINLFDAQLAGPSERFADAAREIWQLWSSKSWNVDA